MKHDPVAFSQICEQLVNNSGQALAVGVNSDVKLYILVDFALWDLLKTMNNYSTSTIINISTHQIKHLAVILLAFDSSLRFLLLYSLLPWATSHKLSSVMCGTVMYCLLLFSYWPQSQSLVTF